MAANSMSEEAIAGLLHRPRLVLRESATQLMLDLTSCNTEDAQDEYLVHTDCRSESGGRAVQAAGMGIKILKHHNEAHPDKLLEYSAEQLENHPFRALCGEVRKASVTAFPSVLSSLAWCTAIATVFAFLAVFFEEGVMSTLNALNVTVSGGLFFLLGPCALFATWHATVCARHGRWAARCCA